MTATACIIVGLVVLSLLGAGLVVGWVAGNNDRHIDALAIRLAAERRMEAATRDTLRAMREVVRQRGQ